MRKITCALSIIALLSILSCHKTGIKQAGNATFKAAAVACTGPCCSRYSLIIDGFSRDSTDTFIPSKIPSNFIIPTGDYITRVNLKWEPSPISYAKTAVVLEMTKAE